jgi:hypothetical protein
LQVIQRSVSNRLRHKPGTNPLGGLAAEAKGLGPPLQSEATKRIGSVAFVVGRHSGLGSLVVGLRTPSRGLRRERRGPLSYEEDVKKTCK